MIVELVATGFIALYVTLVIVGHILLFVAILACLREDRPKDRRQRTELGRGLEADVTMRRRHPFRPGTA